MPPGARKRPRGGRSLELRPADPFELIRWLARSQSDPRKAVAELVQNSLDAGAKEITVLRQRIRTRLCVVVRDDGEGVLPELGREDALQYLATHIGHSRKLGIDSAERARRVIAGKYGVGLLGFWAIGAELELRTRVLGSTFHALRLREDDRHAEILKLPLRIDAPETTTEAVVLDVHESAQRALGGRRLTDYLAAELRGQLLRGTTRLRVEDHVARGLAQKVFDVVPLRYKGERLEVPAEIPIEGFPPLRLEFYLARGAAITGVQVACAGTLVADDLRELGALGLDHAPWVGEGLTGLVDFAAFTVPPGSRRGVLPNDAAAVFARALDALGPLVMAEIARLDAVHRAAVDRSVVAELERALRGLRRRLPHYDLPTVAGSEEAARDANVEEEGSALGDASRAESTVDASQIAMFAPGPLAAVRIAPERVEVAAGSERRVRAVPMDAHGARIGTPVEVAWTFDDASAVFTLRGEGLRPAVAAVAGAQIGTRALLRIVAKEAGVRVESAADVSVVEPEDEAAHGIPEPHLVSDPDGRWRSRMVGERWEVNDAHGDYRALPAEPRARLRYLLALFAKEIVIRTSARPDVDPILESLVEVLAHAERNLARG